MDVNDTLDPALVDAAVNLVQETIRSEYKLMEQDERVMRAVRAAAIFLEMVYQERTTKVEYRSGLDPRATEDV